MNLRGDDFQNMKCKICGKSGIVSRELGVCVDCISDIPEKAIPYIKKAHHKIRNEFNLPVEPPMDPDGIPCKQCANECRIALNKSGYCGIRRNANHRLIPDPETAFVYTYLDSLPTNCCAAWFCPGSRDYGRFNLAVFFYGCNFNCIFCQNPSHKRVYTAPEMRLNEFVTNVMDNSKVGCICYFGGSPEPHLPFALRASEKILQERKIRICWEWNGCGNQRLVRRAAELSFRSDGVVKFDLKAFDKSLSVALSGRPNDRAYENFRAIAEEFFSERESPVLTATTLLVPGYVDKREIEKIARFISELNPEIPYSLLVFHPDFHMMDLPITPRKQVEECYLVAKKYLKNVDIGNKYLLFLYY